ncbi:tetraspanin-18-like [Microcaecilia unicolor]|uniref:Tetraspanin n=1 Tax=Microcaecilia unicolor TaxID=1415580 RepID=A0A6P7ZQR2_9AMPH|nr:tetraspanin-18-like [Microcaecilia unicolor]
MAVLLCMKYLMFIFNALIFVGGLCLLGVGVWVVVDPDGFQSIVTSNPLLNTGAFILLIAGIFLSLLGFLGCYGALRENKMLLMAFFVLILILFMAELVGAILALTYNKKINREFYLSELQMHYKGDNASDAFSKSWNTIMIAFSCCGVSGAEDFGNASSFHEIYPSTPWPDACCRRDYSMLSRKILDRERCIHGEAGYLNNQGCFSTIAKTLKKYISVTAAVGLVVLGIEMFAMFFALCLYYYFD